ncbi:hypothetical protein [Granulicella sp. S156]|jgi:hypothetical protein|uniref:hypothetical protein n=1 Tax=Granulicella sp. S156 TaxID=1747224 RepID=UPI00131C1D0E|nr:hypothetical protein [Granulicella sp. S156]
MGIESNLGLGDCEASPPDVDVRISGIPVEEIRSALRDMLRSSAFAMSKRCGDFLAFVVEQTLLGQHQELKERTIGVAVFGRPTMYDTTEDAVVRIKASEVRKRLGFYYADEGKASGVWISLPRGGYVPVFTRPDNLINKPESRESVATVVAATEPVAPTVQLNVKSAVPGLKYRWRIGSGVLLAALVLVFVGFLWFRRTAPISALAQFWNPVFQNQNPVLLVTTPVPAYVSHGSPATQQGKATTEYVLTTDQFVGQGDVRAAELISTALQGLGHSSETKESNNVDFHELSRHSLVLIGYSATQWAAITQGFRFSFSDKKGGMITDRGRLTEWYPHHLAKDLHTDEDYAIVSRVYVPETRAMVVLVSGATQYGTEDAAELVTNPELLSTALRDAPKDWPKKNLQLVLHLKVIGDTPETPEVVASEFW